VPDGYVPVHDVSVKFVTLVELPQLMKIGSVVAGVQLPVPEVWLLLLLHRSPTPVLLPTVTPEAETVSV
jgi:hypothetical protein